MTAQRTELCPCGRPLHYADPDTEVEIRRLVMRHGETVEVAVPGRLIAYRVPRHYIALHGLKAAHLQELAERHGWERA